MRPGFRTAIICAILFGGTLLLFSRATRCGFVNYDDPTFVTDSPMVLGGLSWAGAAWAFTAPSDYWHPLVTLSHMLDCQLYGLSPAGHHFTSMLWHALNAVLAFLVFRRLTGGMWGSAFAAALFAWHPLRVESVVWITERKDVMSGCFFLLTILAYARFAAVRAAGQPALRAYLLAFACFAAGLMCKPMLVTLPFVLLLLDYWPLARHPACPARLLVLEKVPFLALSCAAAVATVLMQESSDAFVLSLPMSARLGNAVVSLARYLGKFVWPFDLIVCYEHPGSWPAASILGAAALLSCLAAIAWSQRRSRPWIAVGLGWYLVTLLPVLGLLQVGLQAMADRYTYLPLLGVELWPLCNAFPRQWRARGGLLRRARPPRCSGHAP
jgi:protein O-mannosyl-transferase